MSVQPTQPTNPILVLTTEGHEQFLTNENRSTHLLPLDSNAQLTTRLKGLVADVNDKETPYNPININAQCDIIARLTSQWADQRLLHMLKHSRDHKTALNSASIQYLRCPIVDVKIGHAIINPMHRRRTVTCLQDHLRNQGFHIQTKHTSP